MTDSLEFQSSDVAVSDPKSPDHQLEIHEETDQGSMPENGKSLVKERSVSTNSVAIERSRSGSGRLLTPDEQSFLYLLNSMTPEEIQKLKAKLETDTLDHTRIKPKDVFLIDVSRYVDEYFVDFDNEIIQLCQGRTGKTAYAISWFFSALTSIETAIWIPFALFSLGYDDSATVSTMFLLTLAMLSQIPKRFLWRPRPWMLGRAKGVRKDPTSSFPSRAVACAIVFPIVLLLSIEVETKKLFPIWLYIVSVFALLLFTTFARINVGAHYPSDILGGIFMGIAVLLVAFPAVHMWSELKCPLGGCYPVSPAQTYQYGSFWKHVDKIQLLKAGFASLSLATLSAVAPIRFWLKNNYVYGLLLSSLTFRYTFLCPARTWNGFGFGRMEVPNFLGHVKLILLGGAFIGLSFAVKPRRRGLPEWLITAQRLIKFLVMYSSVLAIIIWHRL